MPPTTLTATITSNLIAAALETARPALRRYVEIEMRRTHGEHWERVARSGVAHLPPGRDLDLAALLSTITSNWQSVFRNKLSPMDRSLVGELRETRNRWAHQEAFSHDDAVRALDTTQRLLRSIGAVTEATKIETLKSSFRRESPPPRAASSARSMPAPSAALEFTLDEIVQYLNEEQIRATYGAVAGIVGGIAQGIGARLGGARRRPEVSWVVNASSGLPTGYEAIQMHPALQRRSEVIRSADELRRRMIRWKAARRS